MKSLFWLLLAAPAFAQAHADARVHSLRIRILSTMLTSDDGIGEWGFAALVEADGRKILVDTGARKQTVLDNAKELGVDLAAVRDVVLTHNHGDHTGGLIALRRATMQSNPAALSRAHAGQGIFYPRRTAAGRALDFMTTTRREYEAAGGAFVVHRRPAEIFPGIWLTGPVPRKYPERNWSGKAQVQTPDGWQEDNLPEDMSLVFDTDRGLVVLSGCGHSGMINTIDYARSVIRKAPLYAAVGGFHLYELDDARLAWTAARLREFGLANFLGAHCTGIEATYRIRELAGLSRRTCAVAAVGAVFELGQPLNPGSISR